MSMTLVAFFIEREELRCSEKAWRVDEPLDKYRPTTFNSTERNTRALDYNCHPGHPLAPWLHRSCWRRFDPSSPRNCRRYPDHQPDSRQTRAVGLRRREEAVRLFVDHAGKRRVNETLVGLEREVHGVV